MPNRHSIAALVLSGALFIAAVPAVAGQTGSSKEAEDGKSQDAKKEIVRADVRLLTRLMVCLRDKPPSDCEREPSAAGAPAPAAATPAEPAISPVQGLLAKYRIGKVLLGEGTTALVRTIGTTDAERDAFLMAAHGVYKEIKNATDPGRTETDRREIEELGKQIHERLAEVSLNQPLNAVMRAGYTLADAGDEFPEKLDTGAPSLQSSALAFIDFESKHFGGDTSGFDFSFGGSFGLGPALVISARRPAEIEPDDSAGESGTSGGSGDAAAADAAPTFVPAMMTSLQWSLNARPSHRLGGQSEVSFLWRFGQSRLEDMTVKLGDGEDAELADVVRNGTGRWAWFKEAGVEFRIFDKPLQTVHHTKDTLLPLFAIGAGYRWDRRLQSTFDLDQFEDGDKRYYLRFIVNLAEVLDPRKTDNPGKNTFALKLSVDHQWKRGNSEVPSGTRLMVEAAADILKLFNLGDKDKPATTGTDPAPAAAPAQPAVR